MLEKPQSRGSRKTTYWLFCAGVAAITIGATPAFAGGIYLTEIGSPYSLGTAASGNVTNDAMADSAWTNPAGMTGIEGTEMVAGLQVLIPTIEFESSLAEAGGNDGGNAGAVAAIPSFFYVKPLNERWRFGLSMVAPFGGGFDFGEDFVGRYAIEEIVLQGVALSPSFGYQINDKVSIGFGVSITYTLMEMDFAINQSAVGATDGQVRLEDATDIGYQPFFGLQWQYSDDTVFGLVYRSEMEVDLEGDLSISNLVLPLVPQSTFNMAWDNPQLLEIGIRHRLSDEWTLLVNADWEDWSAFGQNVLTVNDAPMGPLAIAIDRNWKDTYKFGIGAIRELKNGTKFAFGAAYDTSPVDDADRTIDLPSDEQIRLSIAWGRNTGDRNVWGIGATFLWLGDGKVDQVAGGQRFVGEFDRNWILFVGGMYQRRFGG
jgi:long-chain fatty acid transport protein